jgi:8-oxo-dGTP pyrophosphatase MutT (NUDIX family)
MPSESIRPIAICVVRRGGDIFVFEARDSVKGETFYRPLGGGIEFGERGDQAVRRELMEELGAELIHVRQIGVLENIFIYEGKHGHEIAFVFQADFADRAFYNAEISVCKEDNNAQFPAMWKPFDEFATGRAILYPAGLTDLLRG